MTGPTRHEIEQQISDLEDETEDEEDLGDAWRRALGKDPDAEDGGNE